MTYKAFISYSHAVDDKLAPALQSALHRFAKPFYRKRSIRIFRDRSSLQLTPQLWPAIQEALAESEYFLLMASPEAANSRWVQAEVDEWLKLHSGSADKILLVLTEGEAVWQDSENDFDWDRTSALPPNLRGVFKSEPLYSDLRWARKITDLSLRNPHFLEEVGSLGATLHGKSKDEMIGEDVRNHRLFKVTTLASILVLLTLTLFAFGTALYAVKQKNEAERQAAEAVRQRSEADRQRQNAFEFANREKRAAENERLARENEKEQRHKAEQATRNEKTARERAEEKREEAEQQRRLADERRMEAERERNIAASRELASAATSQLSSDPELSLLLSLKAHDVTPTFEAEESMRLSLLRSHVRATYRDIGTDPSPDWKWFINTSGDTVKATELTTGRTINLDGPVLPGATHFVRFSRDGKLLLILYRKFEKQQSIISMWEVGTWRRLADLPSRDYVMDAHFSPDSRLIKMDLVHRKATQVLNLSNLASIEIEEADLSFSPDSKWLIGRSLTSTHLWNSATGQPVWDLDCNAQGVDKGHIFSPNSKYVVFPCAAEGEQANKSTYVFDVITGRRIAEISDSNSSALKFSTDGKWLVSAEGSSAFIWQVDTWQRVATLDGHHTDVSTSAFSSDGRWLATASTDRTTLVWQVENWRLVDRLQGEGGRFLRFSDNSNVLITTGEDDSVSVWQVATWKLITTLQGHFTPLWGGLVVSPNGEYILTGHYGFVARLWTVSADEETTQITGARETQFRQPPRMIYSPDSRHVAIETWDGLVKLVEVETDIKTVLGRGHFLAFSPDGQYVFTKGLQYSIQVWLTSTGKEVAQLHGHTGSHPDENDVKGISFSPNGKWIVTAGGYEMTARIWEVGSWRSVAVLQHAWSVDEAVFSPDSEWIVTAAVTLNVFKVGTWKKVTELRGFDGEPQSVCFSNDGRRVLATAGGFDRAAWIWDVGTWRTALILRGHTQWVTGAQFSPDSTKILTWSWDNTARVWDASTGNTLAVLAGDPIPWRADHPNAVNSASFSPDGKLIETSSGQTVRIWRADNGQIVRILPVLTPGKDVDNGPRTVNGAIFSRDGRSLLAVTNVGIIRVYKWETFAPSDEILALARTRVTRGLTIDEREEYLHEVIGERKRTWSTQ
jgi:WD40 repeat protein